MKKAFFCMALCLLIGNTAFGGVRKNWKVMKNVVTILQGQTIAIAQHIYGISNQTISSDNGQTIYIWGNEDNKIQNIHTKSISSSKESTTMAQSSVNYGYTCYIAFKTNKEGLIIDGIQIGFEPDRLSPNCRQIFLRSYNFCQAVKRETEKEHSVQLKNCYRHEWTEKDLKDFAIPQEYKKSFFYKNDNDVDKFFNH